MSGKGNRSMNNRVIPNDKMMFEGKKLRKCKKLSAGILAAVIVCIITVIWFGQHTADKEDANVVVCNEVLADSPQIVSYTYSNANMELQLPEGWEYEIEEHSEDSSVFGINFRPPGGEDGEISLLYYGNTFGVCGTGLSTKDITFENGLQASIGTYDKSPVWSYMVYSGTPGSYVASVQMDKKQWKEYEDQVMEILGNAKLAQGIMWESEAIEIAREKCTAEYGSARGNYDFETGVWKIRFYNEHKAGTEQNIWVNAEGEVVKEFKD